MHSSLHQPQQAPYRGLFALILGLALLFPHTATALDRNVAAQLPHVDEEARENFIQYAHADHNKAFAIAPGGAWAWSALETSAEEAGNIALQRCQSYTQQTCVLYALNEKVVFDQQAWPQLWRLHDTTANNKAGIRRGGIFPDLRFSDARGKTYHLHQLQGKPLLVHFWGSWCPPCMREMPSLKRLHQQLKQNYGDKVEMVLLQAREPFSDSLAWAKRHGFDQLPLYNSGVDSDQDAQLHISDGQTISDRAIAPRFPTSYVLDAQGRVVFSHSGPIDNWQEYLPFFDDLLQFPTLKSSASPQPRT